MAFEVQPQDTRGYFILPQAPEDAGYYVYGTPANGAGQYAHPVLMSVLFVVEREWQAIETRKFGIGNISFADGPKYKKHGSHKNGLQVDIRPLRKDGRPLGVTRFDHQYDRDGTARLIAILRAQPLVDTILFNDTSILGVRSWVDHDNHFHVSIRRAPE